MSLLTDSRLTTQFAQSPSDIVESSDTENIKENSTTLRQDADDVLELGNHFDFSDFQVVRREFFAHTHEPAVSFNNCKFYVNSACLRKFPDTDFVQVLVHQESRIMALRPCQEWERDSLAWSTISKGKRRPKQTTCPLFFAKVVSMMGWNPDYRYRLLGKLIHANGEHLLAFDLTSTEIYQRTFPEGKRPRSSRTPVFPAGWRNQFGIPFEEHRQSLQINIFDGYAIYSMKGTVSAQGSEGTLLSPTDAVLPSSINLEGDPQ